MKKFYYIIIFIFIIAVVVFSYYLLSNKNSMPSAPQDKILIQTKEGSLPIADITKNPAATLSPNNTLVKNNLDYDLVYFDFGASDKSFLIDIKSSEVESARAKAEADFLQSLGITKEQACLLNVSLRVSKDASDALAGQEFGLSFCPNGKPFTK